MFAILWNVHRAVVQSITFDEVNTYHAFLSSNWSACWTAASNNHVLNSVLARFFISCFGLSHITLRAPALIGGTIYVFSAYRISQLLSHERLLNFLLFLCYVYNPFIMDFLVAARGYGLAVGFLALALYLVTSVTFRDGGGEFPPARRLAAISACAALSFCANFSFAYMDAAVVAFAFIAACLRIRDNRIGTAARFAAACILPALCIASLIVGSVVAHFPKNELYWGARSFSVMSQHIEMESFPELNAFLAGSVLADILHTVQRWALLAVGLISIVYAAVLLVYRRGLALPGMDRLMAAGLVTFALTLTILIRWLQFELFQIPLPLDRTALFIIPPLTYAVGGVFSIQTSRVPARVLRSAGIIYLGIIALYFVGSIRDSYFQEWRGYGADTKAAFPFIRDLSRRTGVREIAADWKYSPSLNFYRILNNGAEVDRFPNIDNMPRDKAIYVLPAEEYSGFIASTGLTVVYRGTISVLAVAVKPGIVPS